MFACYYVVTSIKQKLVLKGHLFSCPVIEKVIRIELLLRGHLSYKVTFSLSQRWPLLGQTKSGLVRQVTSCIKRLPLGQTKSGLVRQVTSCIKRLPLEIKCRDNASIQRKKL
jgi:hypothetical protein